MLVVVMTSDISSFSLHVSIAVIFNILIISQDSTGRHLCAIFDKLPSKTVCLSSDHSVLFTSDPHVALSVC